VRKLTQDALLPLVRDTPLLAPIPEPELRDLLDACRQIVLPSGEALCREGEEGHAMFVVLSGHLVVSRSGKQVAVGSPGDCFGEMALIESRERAVVVAPTPSQPPAPTVERDARHHQDARVRERPWGAAFRRLRHTVAPTAQIFPAIDLRELEFTGFDHSGQQATFPVFVRRVEQRAGRHLVGERCEERHACGVPELGNARHLLTDRCSFGSACRFDTREQRLSHLTFAEREDLRSCQR
jgi:hypothetical protein